MGDVTVLTSIDAIAPPERVRFEFEQGGRTYALEFHPLTAHEVEAIRASLPEPEPPEKPLPGRGAQELKILRQQGFPTTYRDVNDPEYRAAMRRHERALGLEMVRVALRWGPIPGEAPAEEVAQAREAFAAKVRTSLTAGNFDRLVAAVAQKTFSLDVGLLDRFFEPSNPLTSTDGV